MCVVYYVDVNEILNTQQIVNWILKIINKFLKLSYYNYRNLQKIQSSSNL